MLYSAFSHDFPRLGAHVTGHPPRCWTGAGMTTPVDEVARTTRPKKSKTANADFKH